MDKRRKSEAQRGSTSLAKAERRAGATPITTGHTLLTGAWTENVEAAEAAIGRFSSDGLVANACHVALFEIAGDGLLHVNVTHQYATKEVRGWAGPGRVSEGFVHNRTFSGAQAGQMLRQIREMVFATQV
jgi:hypothetical protein